MFQNEDFDIRYYLKYQFNKKWLRIYKSDDMHKISVVRHTIPHNGTVSTHSPFFIIDNCRCALHEMIHPPSGQCCLIYFKAHDSDYNSSFFAQQYLVISL